jgi:hypothetical protein
MYVEHRRWLFLTVWQVFDALIRHGVAFWFVSCPITCPAHVTHSALKPCTLRLSCLVLATLVTPHRVPCILAPLYFAIRPYLIYLPPRYLIWPRSHAISLAPNTQFRYNRMT